MHDSNHDNLADEQLWARVRPLAPDDRSCAGPLELAAFAEGTLDADRRAAVETHLARCGDCRGAVALLARADDDATVLVPHHVRRRVRALVAPPTAPALVIVRRAVAAAAAVAIAVLGYVVGTGSATPGAPTEARTVMADATFGVLGDDDVTFVNYIREVSTEDSP